MDTAPIGGTLILGSIARAIVPGLQFRGDDKAFPSLFSFSWPWEFNHIILPRFRRVYFMDASDPPSPFFSSYFSPNSYMGGPAFYRIR